MALAKLIKLHYWPGIACAWFAVMFIITYLISVLDGHVYPYFPFISDTGAEPPESCVFGQMMNIGAVLMAINTYIRYRQVNFAIKSDDLPLRKRWNILGTLSGTISCLGASVVANFQETVMLPVHVLGAIMIFGNGVIFLFIQTRITFAFRHIYNKYPDYSIGPNMLYMRIAITICFSLLYCTVAICGVWAMLLFTGSTMIWWTEEHGGYYEHLAASIAEWIMVFIFFVYILSFTKEFKSLEYEAVQFKNISANSKADTQETVNGKICTSDSSYI